MNTVLMEELRLAQQQVSALLNGISDSEQRRQYHPELSPLGWHLGHCCYTECYWLQQVVLGDDQHTAPVARLYDPLLTAKPERGAQLPDRHRLLQWVHNMQTLNQQLIAAQSTQLMQHSLMQQDYLLHFLLQHYNQHYETMRSVLIQRTLDRELPAHRVSTPLQALTPTTQGIKISPGQYTIGGKTPTAYDNELPVQQITLKSFRIAARPVSNSHYLAFMNAGGYTQQSLWSKAGWQWRLQTGADCPHHWRKDADRQWYGVSSHGSFDLDGDDVLHGLSYYEATAYANWAGGRLPHEHQWEVASRMHHLKDTGRAWEWCQNNFFAYEGFKPFPYENYSSPSFNDKHFTLRGGSLHTRPAIKRAAFRNFHEAGKRHIFAGLRLVY